MIKIKLLLTIMIVITVIATGSVAQALTIFPSPGMLPLPTETPTEIDATTSMNITASVLSAITLTPCDPPPLNLIPSGGETSDFQTCLMNITATNQPNWNLTVSETSSIPDEITDLETDYEPDMAHTATVGGHPNVIADCFDNDGANCNLDSVLDVNNPNSKFGIWFEDAGDGGSIFTLNDCSASTVACPLEDVPDTRSVITNHTNTAGTEGLEFYIKATINNVAGSDTYLDGLTLTLS